MNSNENVEREVLPEENLKLRRAIYKLKLENSRMKNKFKGLSSTVRQLIVASGKQEEIQSNSFEAEKDYDEIGRNYILVGGPRDPLSIRYDVWIKDSNNNQYKSAERYLWYKKAELFNDTEAMKTIKDSMNGFDAEKAMKGIKNVKEQVWDEVKLAHWEEAQRLKLEQIRWIANILVATGTTYIAVASRDKQIGTGWNKKREESGKPYMWDGENLGGKFLMNYRQQLKKMHMWMDPNEEQETKNKVEELRKSAWRRPRDQNNNRMRRVTRRGDSVGVASTRGRRSGAGGSLRKHPYQQAQLSRESYQPTVVYEKKSGAYGSMPVVAQMQTDSQMTINDPYTYGQPHGYTAFY